MCCDRCIKIWVYISNVSILLLAWQIKEIVGLLVKSRGYLCQVPPPQWTCHFLKEATEKLPRRPPAIKNRCLPPQIHKYISKNIKIHKYISKQIYKYTSAYYYKELMPTTSSHHPVTLRLSLVITCCLHLKDTKHFHFWTIFFCKFV